MGIDQPVVFYSPKVDVFSEESSEPGAKYHGLHSERAEEVEDHRVG